jgi:hypothetical protein
MLTDQKLRTAWKAYLAELAAIQMAEHPSEAKVAELCESISPTGSTEATRVLGEDSSLRMRNFIECSVRKSKQRRLGPLSIVWVIWGFWMLSTMHQG